MARQASAAEIDLFLKTADDFYQRQGVSREEGHKLLLQTLVKQAQSVRRTAYASRPAARTSGEAWTALPDWTRTALINALLGAGLTGGGTALLAKLRGQQPNQDEIVRNALVGGVAGGAVPALGNLLGKLGSAAHVYGLLKGAYGPGGGMAPPMYTRAPTPRPPIVKQYQNVMTNPKYAPAPAPLNQNEQNLRDYGSTTKPQAGGPLPLRQGALPQNYDAYGQGGAGSTYQQRANPDNSASNKIMQDAMLATKQRQFDALQRRGAPAEQLAGYQKNVLDPLKAPATPGATPWYNVPSMTAGRTAMTQTYHQPYRAPAAKPAAPAAPVAPPAELPNYANKNVPPGSPAANPMGPTPGLRREAPLIPATPPALATAASPMPSTPPTAQQPAATAPAQALPPVVSPQGQVNPTALRQLGQRQYGRSYDPLTVRNRWALPPYAPGSYGNEEEEAYLASSPGRWNPATQQWEKTQSAPMSKKAQAFAAKVRQYLKQAGQAS